MLRPPPRFQPRQGGFQLLRQWNLWGMELKGGAKSLKGLKGLPNAPWFAKKKNCSYLFMYYVDPGFEQLSLYEKH